MLRAFLCAIATTLFCAHALAQDHSGHHGQSHAQWHEQFYSNLMRNFGVSMKTLILLAAIMAVSTPAYAQKDEQEYRNVLRGFYNCARLDKISMQHERRGIKGIRFSAEENRFGDRLQHAIPSLTAWYERNCRKAAL